jgi:tetratricopeptide (TPR) repeat protein
VVSYKLRRLPEARRHLESALATFEATKGPRHNHVARVLNDLALVDNAEGNLAGAIVYNQRALAIRREALPADHPEVAGSIENLAELLVEAKRFREAKPLTIELLALREAHIDADLEDYVDAVVLAADDARALGEGERARALLDAASPRVAGRDPEAVAAIASARARLGQARIRSSD